MVGLLFPGEGLVREKIETQLQEMLSHIIAMHVVKGGEYGRGEV